MKLKALVLLPFLLVQLLHAQVFDEDELPSTEESYRFKKINIDVRVGAAMPVGKFADANYFSEDTRAALTGLSLGLEFNAKPVDIVGFGAQITGVVNGYNPEPFDYIASMDSTFSGLSSGNYFNLKILGEFSLGLATEQLEADFKILAGPMVSRLPEQTLRFDFVSASYQETRKASNSVAFCFGLGFDTRYYFKSYYVKTFAEYTRSDVLHEVEYTATGSGVFGRETITTTLQWVTLGVGIGIRF